MDRVSKRCTYDEALAFAENAHRGQLRKGTDIPYITHPIEVAGILATMTDDEDVLIAGLFHDIVEDTGCTLDDIRQKAGERVAFLVSSLTENKRKGIDPALTWEVRKREMLERTRTAPLEVRMIAVADKLSNLRSIAREYREIGDRIWMRFHVHEKEKHAWYYNRMLEVTSALSDTGAWQECSRLYCEVFLEGPAEASG